STARIEFVLSDLQHYSQPVHMVKLPMRVQDIIDQVKAALDENDLPHIHFDIHHAEQPLMADPILLRQALLMLIQNALEALRKDKRVTLRTTLDSKDNTLCFGVWNKGTINLDKVANKLFEPFFTTKPHALGIGLSMARRIAGAHGGTVYLASNDKVRGTCFALKIPATSKANVLAPFSD
ncbi:MAG: ATP-binding protein, partial [Rhodothermales bacterium]